MKTSTCNSLLLLIILILGLNLNAQTLCPVIPAPFYESFNNGTEPLCWENLSSDPSTSPDNFWIFNDQGDYGAANNGKVAGEFAKSDGSNPNPDSMILISPEIDLSQLTTPYLSFEWFSNNTDFPGDNTPLIIDVFDGTTWTNLDTLKGDSSDWIFVNYDLNAFMNQTIQVRFMVNQTLTTNQPIYNDILLDEVRIDDCISSTGQDGSIDVCFDVGSINLNGNIIVKPNGGGYWAFPYHSGFLTQDSILNVSILIPGTYEAYYVERLVCYDTTVAILNVLDYNSSGTAVNDYAVCEGEVFPLFDLLLGNVDLNGTWFDYAGDPLNGSMTAAPSIPGYYGYTYVVSNSLCPNDSTAVGVSVMECGWWPDVSIDKNDFVNISVVPNPASNHLKIINSSNTSALKIEMLDMNGRIVLSENKALSTAEEVTLMIDHLEKGIYTLRVFNNEEQNVYKIVKQ
ncbi:T9SS type A sorting domain-containing protein [Brumimicrobium glaciale]|uniref:T9SS type A sorting domain-containing protein n=1 Tax=Brumimicrobium glaciale TaxID=200475 RepID=A0A4Q4KKE9_9FLAO|nr:T9SS type A sorting domain-containing protein [Brumimicrobium glaciale]RYM33811.1 T9SS type A sorting domain-containing protein [Brumimicrobium glaciale]